MAHDRKDDPMARLTRRVIDEWQQNFSDWLEIGLSVAQDEAESPIEKLMGVALLFADWRICAYPAPFAGFGLGEVMPSWMGPGWNQDLLGLDSKMQEAVIISPQQKVLNYRADFLIIAKLDVTEPTILRAVVECDGHDFHDRTKEQAIRDRERDRAMQSEGYSVFRFTGREIYRDARKCAEEVVQAMHKAAKRARS